MSPWLSAGIVLGYFLLGGGLLALALRRDEFSAPAVIGYLIVWPALIPLALWAMLPERVRRAVAWPLRQVRYWFHPRQPYDFDITLRPREGEERRWRVIASGRRWIVVAAWFRQKESADEA